MTKNKQKPRTRLSMKFLWKLLYEFQGKGKANNMQQIGAYGFLTFVESSLKENKP